MKIEIPLNIPDITIIDVSHSQGKYLFHIESTISATDCRKCGAKIHKFHGVDQQIRLRHFPILNEEVYLCIRPKRFQCMECDGKPTTTQKLSWYEQRKSYTKLYEEYILLQLVNSTVEDVSLKERVGYETIMGMLLSYFPSVINWDELASIDILGLDEIALKKGHQSFVVIVTGRHRGKLRILSILKDRKKETVKKFLQTIPSDLKKTINQVCTDMYDGYINACKEELGDDVIIVIDRFHGGGPPLAKNYRKSADSFRKAELKRLKKKLSEEKYQDLQGNMWAFRKKAEHLSEQEKKVLTLLFAYSPRLKQVYDVRNELTDIFNENIDQTTGINKINNWITKVKSSGLTCFNTFLNTLENRMNEITNYFIDRNSSGFVEGLNNKIKVIKRRCYGILNITHLFRRITLDLEGYLIFT